MISSTRPELSHRLAPWPDSVNIVPDEDLNKQKNKGYQNPDQKTPPGQNVRNEPPARKTGAMQPSPEREEEEN